MAMNSDSDYDTALSAWFPKPQEAAEPKSEERDIFGSGVPDAAQARTLERVRGWVRERFALRPETAILVSEVACNLPGCPPLETVVAFWENEQRHHFKLFKRAEEVSFDNLPYAWMKDQLIVPEGFGCECC
jgi:nitrate reductase delta subunit